MDKKALDEQLIDIWNKEYNKRFIELSEALKKEDSFLRYISIKQTKRILEDIANKYIQYDDEEGDIGGLVYMKNVIIGKMNSAFDIGIRQRSLREKDRKEVSLIRELVDTLMLFSYIQHQAVQEEIRGLEGKREEGDTSTVAMELLSLMNDVNELVSTYPELRKSTPINLICIKKGDFEKSMKFYSEQTGINPNPKKVEAFSNKIYETYNSIKSACERFLQDLDRVKDYFGGNNERYQRLLKDLEGIKNYFKVEEKKGLEECLSSFDKKIMDEFKHLFGIRLLLQVIIEYGGGEIPRKILQLAQKKSNELKDDVYREESAAYATLVNAGRAFDCMFKPDFEGMIEDKFDRLMDKYTEVYCK